MKGRRGRTTINDAAAIALIKAKLSAQVAAGDRPSIRRAARETVRDLALRETNYHPDVDPDGQVASRLRRKYSEQLRSRTAQQTAPSLKPRTLPSGWREHETEQADECKADARTREGVG